MAQKQEKGQTAQRQEKTPVPVKGVPPSPGRVPERGRLWPMSAWEREIDHWFDDFRRHLAWPRLWAGPLQRTEITVPALDVYEKGDEVVVKAEIPGMTKDQIEVHLTDSTLTVTGEKKQEEEVKDKDYYRCERSFGSFARTVQLPAEVKTEGAKATFKDGVLEVRLPKSEAAKRRAVKVQVQ